MPEASATFHISRGDGAEAHARYSGTSDGYSFRALVDHASGSKVMGKGICMLAPGGGIGRHLHSYEEAFYVLEGTVRISRADRSYELVAGDFGFFPVGDTHSWHNAADTPARWLEVATPQPMATGRQDTFFVDEEVDLRGDVEPVDLGDPRTRYLGHWETADLLSTYGGEGPPMGMDAGVTRVAPGLYVKELVNKTLGAYLVQLIMVEFAPGTGMGGTTHDHTYEESFYLLDGEVDGIIEGQQFKIRPGDGFWVGVGTVHGWHNSGETPVRWLESQCPQPPARHSYRWTEQWEYLARKTGAGDGRAARSGV